MNQRHLQWEVDVPPVTASWLGRNSLEAMVKAERQIVFLRWLGLLTAAALAPFLFGGQERWGIWAVCAAAALYSLVFQFYVIPHRPRWLLNGYLITVWDTALAGAVVYLTGGLHSEFYLVYYLIAVLCAVRFGGRRAIVSIGVALLTYTVIVVLKGSPLDSATLSRILFRLGFAAITAIFVGFVVDRAQEAERQVDAAALGAKQELAEATEALTQSLDLEEVLNQAARWGAGLAGASRAVVESHPPAEVREWLWRNAEHQPRRVESGSVSGAVGLSLEFPVLYRAETLGWLRLTLPPGRTLDTLRHSVVETFAARCGPAFANAWTFAAVQLQALVDPTTGLANHRRFKEYLEDCAREAQAARRPLSVLMLDLDMFKEFNDTFGHLAGDKALRRVGAVLADCSADQGLVARYGGDEFVVVLPGVGEDAAANTGRSVLNRFRQAVRAGLDGLAPPMGLSIGCATAQAGDADYQTLVGRADLAMYLAKRSGGGLRIFDEVEETDPLRSLMGSIMKLTKVDISALAPARPSRSRNRHPGPTRTSEVVRLLITAMRTKDPALYVHCRNVARLCFRMGRRLGLSAWEIHDVGLAGLLHDIGKICVPDAILQKPGSLDATEMAAIHLHPIQGAKILEAVPSLAAVATAVRHHHENFDGTGYPDRRQGDRIPLPSRIVLVADAYDAITSDRPYRSGRSPSAAVRILRENQGRQFDPSVVATLTTLLGQLNLDHARSQGAAEVTLR